MEKRIIETFNQHKNTDDLSKISMKNKSQLESDWPFWRLFHIHLTKILKENDVVSYWIVRDLYQHYLTSIKDEA
jgi:hypothetical protein